MNRMFAIIISILVIASITPAYCEDKVYTRSEMINQTTKALMKIPEVKTFVQRVEKKAYILIESKTGIRETTIKYAAGIAASLTKGEIDTRVFKRVRWTYQNLYTYPEIVYNLNTKELTTQIRISLDF